MIEFFAYSRGRLMPYPPLQGSPHWHFTAADFR